MNTALALGETAEASGRLDDAIGIYRRIADDKHLVSDDVLSRLGAVALRAGDRKTAAEAYLRVYYEFALSDLATAAASHITGLQDQIVKKGYQQDLGRAAMLFGAKALRRSADRLPGHSETGERGRSRAHGPAGCRVRFLSEAIRRRQGRRAPVLERASRKAEARFFISALRELGQHDEYVAQTRALVADFPGDSWAEEALNNLGTHHILIDEDEEAARVFGELYEKFPTGPRSGAGGLEAYGWWSYRNGDHDSAVKTFESAASSFPRSDYRPSYLYWAARAHAKLGHGETAGARFRLVYNDYGSSYYGRLAQRRVERRPGQPEPERAVARHCSRSRAPHRGRRPLT